MYNKEFILDKFDQSWKPNINILLNQLIDVHSQSGKEIEKKLTNEND